MNMQASESEIKWYQTEQEVKADESLQFAISSETLEKVRASSGGKIPEERLMIVARNQIVNTYAKDVFKVQNDMLKSDFNKVAQDYLSKSIEECLDSDEILLNILALVDRRVGKKRITGLEKKIRAETSCSEIFL